MNLSELTQAFERRFASSPRLFAAPGRVNLIGEHTDYNDGFVLPMALELATVVAASPRSDGVLRVYAQNFDETREVSLRVESAAGARSGHWLDYVEGTARVLLRQGVEASGADLWIRSELPLGAGLSSSAALELAVGLALTSLTDQPRDLQSLALAGQRAEHEYVGTQCGIMDQLCVALAQPGYALFIDCRSLAVQPVPLAWRTAEGLREVSVVICDSGVKHSLASSAYNQRRAECESAVRVLRQHAPEIRALRDVSRELLERHATELSPTELARARHVVTENARTEAAREALLRGELALVGQLMYESHASLRDDYQVSVPELDGLVEIASRVSGVYGSRMTGGGFGGCTVSLCEPSVVSELEAAFTREYSKRFSIAPRTFVSRAGAGVAEVFPPGVPAGGRP
ncbi:MAG TPA: galactokinase [Polyangiaceae bacterium]|nr:galactokinase [Polyangiaceae bacterium]